MTRPAVFSRSSRTLDANAWGRVLVVVIPVLVAFLVAPVLVGSPVKTIVVIAGLGVVVVLLARVEWAALAFVAVEPFEDYVRAVSASAVKGLGAVLVIAWLIHAATPGAGGRAGRMRVGRRGALEHPVAIAGIAMVAATLASTVLHPNGSVGSEVLTRYLSFLGALIVLIDLLFEGLPVRRVATVFVGSCTLAAAVGLANFLSGAAARAGGPLGDPNDFAFFMVAALPLALVLRSAARRPWLWDVAAVLITAAMIATLSRGALFAVIAMVAYAMVTGVIRARVVAAIGVALVLAFAVLAVTDPALIENSLSQKAYVASQNVDDRLVRWQVAAHMTVDDPVLGVGPGGFRTEYDSYVDLANSGLTHNLDVAHETYLEVSAELGLVGLATFLGVLGYGFGGARRRSKEPDAQDWLAGGVCAALLGTVVAAIFLTEQYYLPLWLLAALGAAMDPKFGATARTPDFRSDQDLSMISTKGAR